MAAGEMNRESNYRGIPEPAQQLHQMHRIRVRMAGRPKGGPRCSEARQQLLVLWMGWWK